MEINRGDIFWVNFSPSKGSELKNVHPALVIQSTKVNKTNINTVVVIRITSNTKFAKIKGNFLLEKNVYPFLKKDSVINVSQIFTIDKSRLENKIGSIALSDVKKVITGVNWLFGNFS